MCVFGGQTLAKLRTEADANLERAEAAEAKNKILEQESVSREQEISSLTHRVTTLENDLEKAEAKVSEMKGYKDEESTHRDTNESLNRKIALLESELDMAEKNLRETTDKYVYTLSLSLLHVQRADLCVTQTTPGRRESRTLWATGSKSRVWAR